MGHLMKLAEVLRDIAEERKNGEIEQALDLCAGFADRVSRVPDDAEGYPETLLKLIVAKFSPLPN